MRPPLLVDYDRVRRVCSFDELVSTPLAEGVNALYWERSLPGEFSNVVAALGQIDGIENLDPARLRLLPVSAAGKVAVEIMLADHQRLLDRGLAPELNCIASYPRDDEPGAVCTDVYSFHADRAPIEADTYLCTYYGAPSEGLRNEEARRRVDVPEIRAQLLREFGGADDTTFADYLAENSYDLHYAAAPGARPYSFGVGHLWRIAVDYPGNPVPPCVHRAPDQRAGDPPRLLLIS
jgi:hypothetical protein